MKFKPTPLSAFRRHKAPTRAMAACISPAIILAILTAAQAQAAEFHPLGFAFNSHSLFGNYVNISEDGSVVVGSSLEGRLIRWTRETGPKLLGPELNPLNPILLQVSRSSMSGDASTVVTTISLGAIKISDGVIEVLPVGPDVESSRAVLISQDGSTVTAGYIERPDSPRKAVFWTDDGIFELPGDFTAVGISASGDVMVYPGENQPIRWSEETGAQELPSLPSKPLMAVLGLSSDGRWSVGRAWIFGERVQRKAVRWDGLSAPELLLSTNSNWGTIAFDVTADGSRIGGLIYPDNTRFAAGLWTEETGMMVPPRNCSRTNTS